MSSPVTDRKNDNVDELWEKLKKNTECPLLWEVQSDDHVSQKMLTILDEGDGDAEPFQKYAYSYPAVVRVRHFRLSRRGKPVVMGSHLKVVALSKELPIT